MFHPMGDNAKTRSLRRTALSPGGSAAIRPGHAGSMERPRLYRNAARSSAQVSMARASAFLQSTGAPGMPVKRTEGRPASKVERKCVHRRAPTLFQGRGKHMRVEGGFQFPCTRRGFCHCHRQEMSIIPGNLQAGYQDRNQNNKERRPR